MGGRDHMTCYFQYPSPHADRGLNGSHDTPWRKGSHVFDYFTLDSNSSILGKRLASRHLWLNVSQSQSLNQYATELCLSTCWPLCSEWQISLRPQKIGLHNVPVWQPGKHSSRVIWGLKSFHVVQSFNLAVNSCIPIRLEESIFLCQTQSYPEVSAWILVSYRIL